MSREKKVFLLSSFLVNFPFTFIVGSLSDRIAGGGFVRYSAFQWTVMFLLGLGICVLLPLGRWSENTRKKLFPKAEGTRLAAAADFFFYIFYYQVLFSVLSAPIFHFWTPAEKRSIRSSLSSLLPYFLAGLVLDLLVGLAFIRPCDLLAEKLIPEESPRGDKEDNR